MLAPHEPGDAVIRVTSGDIDVSSVLSFVPDLRPALAVGIIEGQASMTRCPRREHTGDSRRWPRIGAIEHRNGLHVQDGVSNFYGRAAFFYKGVLGMNALTTSYDSDKDRIRLFRDIQPDQFYPIYGDSSLRGFDAQSTRRGYLRLDHTIARLLFGDFTSEGRTDEARNLGLYQRSLTGGKGHYERGNFEFDLWAARRHGPPNHR